MADVSDKDLGSSPQNEPQIKGHGNDETKTEEKPRNDAHTEQKPKSGQTLITKFWTSMNGKPNFQYLFEKEEAERKKREEEEERRRREGKRVI